MRRLLHCAVAVLLSSTPTAAEVRYEVVNLQPIVGGIYLWVSGPHINNTGQIAGSNGIWTPERGFRPLGFDISAINDVGQVVGTDYTSAYLYTPSPDPQNVGNIQNLGPGIGIGLNDFGTVVGTTVSIEDGKQPWRWTSGGGRETLLLGEFTESTSIDVNNSETVIGGGIGAYGLYRWLNGSGIAEYLPEFIVPRDTNNLGQIVGEGRNRDAVIYSQDAGLLSIGRLNNVPSQGTALNDLGQVVGTSTEDIDDDLGTAWLASPGEGIMDLNLLIEPQGAAGWFLREATDINEAGQIVGFGRFGNVEYVPFLLNPVPESGTLQLALLVSAILLFATHNARNRRKRAALV